VAAGWTATVAPAFAADPGAPAPLPRVQPAGVGLSAERLEQMSKFFRGEVAKNTTAGYVLLVARHGKLAYADAIGLRDREHSLPMTLDTRFRIASMTKPVTSVAVMMLYEESRLHLDDPVSRFLPEFANARVYAGKDERGELKTEPVKQPMTIRHLLTHTSGLGYGPGYDRTSDLAKAWGALELSGPGTLAAKVQAIAALPLYSQPGEQWRYSYADDVLGRVVEVISGMPFDQFLRRRIFQPLGMRDTDFWIPQADAGRLARVYVHDKTGALQPVEARFLGAPHDRTSWPSGGGGLISTAGDYLRFAQMLANGGSLDGRQILSPVTVQLMTSNQVPPEAMAKFWGSNSLGLGYGLGVAPVIDANIAQQAGLDGDYSWGGFLDTHWVVSPQSGLVAVLLAQLSPVGNTAPQPTYVDFRNLLFATVMTLDPVAARPATAKR
jgi:CubicO group peptidase (beta-lactamase class C family)